MKQKLFTFFLALIASVNAIYASDTQVDGIWYNFDNDTQTASVTYRGYSAASYDDEYSGLVIIPETVTYNGTTYSVTRIGGNAFRNCSSLTSVTIPNSVTSIGNGAFYGCSSLTSVTIPNSVTSIGNNAFYDCSSLTSVTIGKSVTSIGNYAFENCSSLTKTNYTGDVAGWCNINFGGVYANPMFYSHNFYINDQEIKDLVIPNSVTSIGQYAFAYCSSLTSVTIPNSVTSIGNGAFLRCSFIKDKFKNQSTLDVEANNYWGAHIADVEINGLLIRNDTVVGCRPSVTMVIFPDYITCIGEFAFYNCSSLTSVTIPNSVTSIERYAFSGCSSLTSVTIGNSVTSIGDYAFRNCSSLTKTNYTGDVAGWCNINFGGVYANPMFYSHNFYINDQEIKDLVIPNSVTSIGGYAFYGCSSLASVTIPNSVTSIGNDAFENCSSLTSVTINSNAIVSKDYYSSSSNISYIFDSQVTEYIIGDDVKKIGSYAFCDCSSLTSITIPNSVTSIGGYAFYGCSSLTSVTIPNSVTSIGGNAFYNCKSLTSITIGNSVTSIGNDAFSKCSSLTKTNYTGDVAGWCNINFGGVYANPMFYSHNFYINDQEIKDLVIPNSVTSIGQYTFAYCSSLTSVTIPNSVTSIGNGAFAYCSSLTSVTIGESVTNIGGYAFYGCSSLASVTIPNSVTSIGEEAFGECTFTKDNFINYSTLDAEANYYWGATVVVGNEINGLIIRNDTVIDCRETVTSVEIPNSVTSIGEWAFSDCSSLTSVTIPNSVTSIGEWAFSGCFSLTKTNYTGDIAGWCNIKFGDGEANPMCQSHNFYINDQEIKDLVIPNTVDSIHNYAFAGCSSLTSVTIPNSVTSIGNDAFSWCSSLTKTNYTGDIAGWCNIKFGDGEANPMCQSHNFYINDQEIKDLVIPNSVTSIGNKVFYGCSSLTSITCEAETPPTLGSYIFYGVSKSIPVYVPCGCVGAYKAKSGWKDFTNIQEPLAEYSIEVDVNDNIMGTAKVDINSACGNQISATPNFGYHLVQWSDGNTDNPRSLVLTQDTILTAEFAPNKYTITTISSDIQRGTTQGDTVVNYLDIVTICANANYGYHFTQWNDANIENPRQVQVTGDTTYTAIFDKNTYTISLSCNEEQGRVEGVTSAEYLDTVTISATPNIGYHFVQWNDGNTDTIRTLVLTQDTILTAEFAQSRSGQCGANLYWELIETTLHITGSGEMYNYTSDTAPWKLLVSSINSLTIAEDVTSIERSAFSDCTAIESIVWNAKNYANPTNKEIAPFYDIRSQIKSFTFGEAVECIPAYLCYGMDKLTSVTIPNNVTSIGEGAFSNCSAIESIVWSAKNFADPADKEVAPFYDIRSQIKSFTFGENVEHIPAYLCYGMDKLTSVTTPNSLKTIGTSAFEGCIRLSKISLGTGLEEIAANAFAGCTRLYDIYVYAAYPPFADESSFANYNVYVYIPCEYQRDYTLDVVWGKFKFIECIDSEEATTDGNVTIVPGYNDVTITWPTEDNADNYAIVIEKDGEVFCTLTFNADGQLLNIAFAPARNGDNRPVQYAEQAVSGYRFTVTGLTEATRYAYNVTTKDAANKTIATYSGEFTTKGGITTAVEDILHSTTNCQKLLRDGQLIIIRDGKTYNVMGKAL